MSARLARRGLAGAALLTLAGLLAGCVSAPSAPVSGMPPEPLPTSDGAPLAALELERLVLDVAADLEDVWTARLAARDVAPPVVETVVLHDGENHPTACPGEETEQVVTDDDAPRTFRCPDGTATLVVPLAPLVPLGDFAAAFLVAREYGDLVGRALGATGGESLGDCLAGVWAADADARGSLETGDVDQVRELLADESSRLDAFLQGFEGMPGLDRGDVDACIHAFSD